MSDVQVLKHLEDHYDTNEYQIGLSSYRRKRKAWGLLGTRQQRHTAESIYSHVSEIRSRFPTRGAEGIRHTLREVYGDRVPRSVITKLLHSVEPDAVARRKGKQFKRRQMWTAGVNDIWSQDQHDKFGFLGLWLHLGVEPFSGEINHLRVWHSNRHPALVASYYFDTVRRIGGIPIITQSDLGTENYGVANAHTVLRHRLDPSLASTLQHRFAKHHGNVVSEIKWSIFRREFAPGFEDMLRDGVAKGWYDVNNPLEVLVFRWVVIPWLQHEVDEWVRVKNRSRRRANKNKILPNDIPYLIRTKPEHYNALDFKIHVPSDILDEVEAEYAPRDHPVFDLIPAAFHEQASQMYVAIGSPPIMWNTFWDVYRTLLAQFKLNGGNLTPILQAHQEASKRIGDEEEASIELIPDLEPFREGDVVVGPKGYKYIGGLASPPTSALIGDIELIEQAAFTDSEDDGDGIEARADSGQEFAVFTDDDDDDEPL